ncbi:hypothetical protein K9M41_00570 [Candidatus Gracilibacteria bacterium]|nr:hypothetical protein [Candidatus Gracilibacteria bacterium]
MTELHFTGTDLRKIIPPYDWTPEGFDSTKVHTLRFEDLSIPQIMTEYERVLSWCRSMPFPVETVSITVNQINVMSIFAELIKKFWIVILLAFLPDLASFYCLTRVKPQRTTMLAAVFTLEWLAYLLFIVSFIASGAGLWIINAPLQMWLMTMVPIAVGLVAAVYFSRLNYFKYWTIVVALICQQIVAWPLSIPTNATGLSKPVYEAENLRYVQDRWGDLSSSKSNLYTAKLKPYREDMRRKKEKMWQDLGAFNSATNFSLSAFTTPNIDKERAMEMFGKDSVKISSWEKYDRSHKTVLKLEESQHDTLTNLLKLPPIGRVTVHNVRSQYRMLFQEEASRWNLKYTSEDEASYVKDQDGPKKIEGKLLDWGPGVTRGFTLGVVFKQGIMQFFASTNVEIYAALFLILGWFYRRRVVVANSPL